MSLIMEFRVSMKILAMVGMLFLITGSSMAHYFYVGGEEGWRKNPSESFNDWAGRNRFQANDTLVFKYKQGEDSVLMVTEERYYSCRTSNPIEYHSSGTSVIELGRSGPFFFISGVRGRCKQGQKMIVVVMSPRRNATATATPTSPPEASPPSPYPTAAPLSPSSAANPPTAPSNSGAFLAPTILVFIGLLVSS